MAEPLSCSECTFCCKWMSIDDLDPPSPEGKWCQHVRVGAGCGIYETRPQSCRQFSCLWLESQSREESERMPLEMRPDRSKVMLLVHGDDVVAKVDPGRPEAYKREPIAGLLKAMLRSGARVFVGINGKGFILREIKKP